MKARIIIFAVLSCIVAGPLNAQIRHDGSVELLDVSDDNTRALFQVDGIAAKKGEIALSARETVFYKLFYEGVEGVNDDKPLVTKAKNYYVENFFSKKNPAMNRFIVLEEQKGDVIRNTDGLFIGSFEMTINLKALMNALNKAGATDVPVVRTVLSKKNPIGIGAGARQRKEQDNAPSVSETAPAKAGVNRGQEADPIPAKVLVTKDGVGPVRIGQDYTISEEVLNKSSLPDRYPSLYDEISCDRNQFSGNFEIACRLNRAWSLFVFCDEDDHAECFLVVTDQAVTEKGLSSASTASAIMAAGGKTQKMPMKENDRTVGYRYRLELDGIYFLFRNSDVTDGKIRPDAVPYGISNTLFGGITEDELSIL